MGRFCRQGKGCRQDEVIPKEATAPLGMTLGLGEATPFSFPEAGSFPLVVISCGKVAHFLERRDLGASGGHICAELMLDQVHDQRIETTLRSVIQVLIDFLVSHLSDERPG